MRGSGGSMSPGVNTPGCVVYPERCEPTYFLSFNGPNVLSRSSICFFCAGDSSSLSEPLSIALVSSSEIQPRVSLSTRRCGIGLPPNPR